MTNSSRLATFIAFALALTVFHDAPRAQAPGALFEDTSVAAPLAADTGGPTVLRARVARPRFDRLAAAATAGMSGDRAPLLTINLFDDASVVATHERYETDAFGHQSWVGRVAGDALSTVVLTWKGDVLSGVVQSGGALYRLLGQGGTVVIEQLDPRTFPRDRAPLVPPPGELIRPPADLEPRLASGEVVDIYVYYTAQARIDAGGQAALEAQIAQSFTESNTAYARSNVNATIRLVGAGELAGYVQNSVDMGNDLDFFTNSPTVAATRNATGADLMHLIVTTPTAGTCGIAWIGPSANFAHGVTARQCFAGFTFTHEVGHNFGNEHAPVDPVGSNPFRPYSFGYKNCGANPFTTIMAYGCPANNDARLLNLSNPAVLDMGLVTGTATQNNALSQSEAFPFVQAFRAPGTTTLPSAPQNLQATVAGNNLAISWQAPAQGAPITGYILQAGTAAGLSNLYNGPIGNVTSVAGPVANGTYYFRVLAQNALGTGPATPDVAATVGAPPGPPQNFVATANAGTVFLSWAPPVSGGTVSTYILQAGSGPGLSNLFNGAVGPGTAISGPVAAGTYFLRVLAQGPGGTSPPSAEMSVTVGSACTVPAAPVLSGGQAGGVVTINWTTPAGGPVTGYTLRAGSSSGASNLYNAGVGLINGGSAPLASGSYYFGVIADAACGSSGQSNELLVVVP
ncbi:MAG TPA: zinc-dependent metalloprotease family protein [Vicinamibacterales bacterium]|nr:zinc-dependent metalloprotease family protein [Vicinamibacterales bacterium]